MTTTRMVPDRVARVEARCREAGLALTVQRRAILRELLARRDHPTADQVYDAVRGQVQGLSRTTVYRVLDTLVRVGAISKVAHTAAVVRFDPNTSPHHHLICRECGVLTDLDMEEAAAIPLPEREVQGFVVTGYTIHFTGICARCRQLESEEREDARSEGLENP